MSCVGEFGVISFIVSIYIVFVDVLGLCFMYYVGEFEVRWIVWV